MGDDHKQSRINKFEKRRRNTKKISILMVIAGILLLVLLFIWIFGDKDKGSTDQDNHDDPIVIEEKPEPGEQNDNHNSENQREDEQENENENNDSSEIDTNDEDAENNENDDQEEDFQVDTEQIESTDENVIEAYKGNWKPIGTVQEGPHTTNYNDGSQDRIEIKQAVMSATGLGEDLTEHWIGNGGDQKVVATVANPGNTEIYRVYLSWVDQEGWLVTQVERLKELDLN